MVIQQQNLQYNQQPMMVNDDSAKWILEPLVICPLDPTAFLRKESIEVCLKTKFDFYYTKFDLFSLKIHLEKKKKQLRMKME